MLTLDIGLLGTLQCQTMICKTAAKSCTVYTWYYQELTKHQQNTLLAWMIKPLLVQWIQNPFPKPRKCKVQVRCDSRPSAISLTDTSRALIEQLLTQCLTECVIRISWLKWNEKYFIVTSPALQLIIMAQDWETKLWNCVSLCCSRTKWIRVVSKPSKVN